MLKKVILTVLTLCLLFSITVMAESDTAQNESFPDMQEWMSQNAERFSENGGNFRMPPSGDMEGRRPSNMPNGQMPEGNMQRGQRPQGNFNPPQNQEEFKIPQGETNPDRNSNVNTNKTTPQTNDNNPSDNPQTQNESQGFRGPMQGGMGGFPGDMQNFNNTTKEEQPKGFLGFLKTYSTPITSVILLGLAFIFVIFYRRKNF